ncbi:hypothetical protein BDV23DRAFT_112655 [Aspergillus alliaceus]|uniref:Uncharacterized protein n=1 Tax=Petromyces alliaceus TaxID=209559 RepID=A0A5N7C2V1_PETAA|nr:hypothetical protein BDV23DRAFT_112655 [Aspergillus alliaceus]
MFSYMLSKIPFCHLHLTPIYQLHQTTVSLCSFDYALLEVYLYSPLSSLLSYLPYISCIGLVASTCWFLALISLKVPRQLSSFQTYMNLKHLIRKGKTKKKYPWAYYDIT